MCPDINNKALIFFFQKEELKQIWEDLQLPDAGFLFFCKSRIFSGGPKEEEKENLTSLSILQAHK